MVVRCAISECASLAHYEIQYPAWHKNGLLDILAIQELRNALLFPANGFGFFLGNVLCYLYSPTQLAVHLHSCNLLVDTSYHEMTVFLQIAKSKRHVLSNCRYLSSLHITH